MEEEEMEAGGVKPHLDFEAGHRWTARGRTVIDRVVGYLVTSDSMQAEVSELEHFLVQEMQIRKEFTARSCCSTYLDARREVETSFRWLMRRVFAEAHKQGLGRGGQQEAGHHVEERKQKARLGAPRECAEAVFRGMTKRKKSVCKPCWNGEASKPGSGGKRMLSRLGHLEDSQESVSLEVVGRSRRSGAVRYRLQLAKRVVVQGGARALARSSGEALILSRKFSGYALHQHW